MLLQPLLLLLLLHLELLLLLHLELLLLLHLELLLHPALLLLLQPLMPLPPAADIAPAVALPLLFHPLLHFHHAWQ
jgi:hypothetical protein